MAIMDPVARLTMNQGDIQINCHKAAGRRKRSDEQKSKGKLVEEALSPKRGGEGYDDMNRRHSLKKKKLQYTVEVCLKISISEYFNI